MTPTVCNTPAVAQNGGWKDIYVKKYPSSYINLIAELSRVQRSTMGKKIW